VCIGLPAPSCSRCLCPGWSHHTPGSLRSQRDIGTGNLIPVTNPIEALNSKLRRAVRARGHFPTDDAALKLLFLVLNRSEKEWTMPAREWCMAKAQFAVLFGERFTQAMA
jgi:transposase-like protein